MQSLIEKANTGGHFENGNSRRTWGYDWFTPTHAASVNAMSSGSNGQLSDGTSVERYPFKFKTWIKKEECTWRKILEANDSMELLGNSDTALVDGQQVSNRPANGDSLTAEDIRGAVGDVDGISGFSGSGAHSRKEQETEKPDAKDQDVKMDGE